MRTHEAHRHGRDRRCDADAARARPRVIGLGAVLVFFISVGSPLPPSGVGQAATPPAAGTEPVGEAVAELPVEAAPAPAADPAVVAAPSAGELYPVGISAPQQHFTPTPEQLDNARAIVDAGRAMDLPPRAWVIAVGTALQESNLRNLGHLGARNDHDSLGLFQQRPSAGWGTPEQVTDPTYAATAFYNRLRRVRDWPTLPLTVAAQRVQISAYPDHYAKHELEAGDIIRALYGEGPFAGAG